MEIGANKIRFNLKVWEIIDEIIEIIEIIDRGQIEGREDRERKMVRKWQT